MPRNMHSADIVRAAVYQFVDALFAKYQQLIERLERTAQVPEGRIAEAYNPGRAPISAKLMPTCPHNAERIADNGPSNYVCE